MSGDLRARLDLLVDTDPLALRDEAFGLLARAERMRAALEEIRLRTIQRDLHQIATDALELPVKEERPGFAESPPLSGLVGLDPDITGGKSVADFMDDLHGHRSEEDT